ncbi:protein phosphatase 1 regulatory subunit 3G-like [Pholidichthys leucotaenia]
MVWEQRDEPRSPPSCDGGGGGGGEPLMEEEEEEEEEEVEGSNNGLRRSCSLPAYLTGGGDARKRVVFADSMGLTLASVRRFSSLEEPRIPAEVLSRHRTSPPVRPPQQEQHRELLSGLCHTFTDLLSQHHSLPELQDVEWRVQQLRVCLERATVTGSDVRGQIRVLSRSTCAAKEVGVRYTFNNWITHADSQAVPVPVDQKGFLGERFVFTAFTPPFLEPGSAVHFAVYMRGEEGEFWDNNEGQNYTLRLRYHGTDGIIYGSQAFPAT